VALSSWRGTALPVATRVGGWNKHGIGFMVTVVRVSLSRGLIIVTTQSRRLLAGVDGKPLTYAWTIPKGSPQAAILGGTTATPTVQFENTPRTSICSC
jgi:hypothetical protein